MATEPFEFTTEIVVEANPDLVYRFFTEVELLERWHGLYAETEAVPGGKFLLNVTGEDVTRGHFLELEPGRRIVFTWGFQQAGSSTVEVTLTPERRGTRVRVWQYGFDDVDSRDGHEQGWNDYLKRLALVATGASAGPDARRKPNIDRRQAARIAQQS